MYLLKKKYFIALIFAFVLLLTNINIIKATEVKPDFLKKGTVIYSDSNSNNKVKEIKSYNVQALINYNDINNGKVYVNVNGITGYVNKKNISNRPISYSKSTGLKNYSRYELDSMLKNKNKEQYKVPSFDTYNVKDLKNAVDENGQKMNVWDSWPLQNKDGTIANYKGFNIVFAMGKNEKIYVFYKKSSEKSTVNNWKLAGRAFSDNDVVNDNGNLTNQFSFREWSGSSMYLNKKKNYVNLFYTVVNRKKVTEDNQRIGKSKIKFNINNGELSVDHSRKNKTDILFDGQNSKIYQTFSNHSKNIFPETNQSDCFGLRDPHYIEDDGKKYLLFQANLGDKYGFQGINNVYNKYYYGGNASFQKKERNRILQNDNLFDRTQFSNAAIGVIELNNDYSLKKVKKPLISFSATNDMMERPNVFKYKGRWYLFTDTHGFKFATEQNESNKNDEFMLGFSSKSLLGNYKPLNKNGLVLYNNVNQESRNYSYSFYPVKTKKGIVVTSFAGVFGGDPNGHFKQTFAPSYTLKIDGDKTSTKNSKVLGQGQLSY